MSFDEITLKKQVLVRAPIFASFQLGDEEFAVPAMQVQEAVNFPAQVVAMPLSPDFVRGVFELRGAMVPMLDMDVLLGHQRRLSADGTKVVIVTSGGARLGLIFDDTRRVLRPATGEVQSFEYPQGSVRDVVCGVIRQADGLVRILDLERLLAIKEVPQQRTPHALNATRAKTHRRRCVTFCSGSARMAFPISEIREILPAIDIQRSPIPEPLCAGIMQLRGRVLPVVKFAELVGASGVDDLANAADRRVIVVESEGAQVGLLVDAVESIAMYTLEDVVSIPVLNSSRAAMFSGCVKLGEQGHVFLLDPQAVLSREELARITGNHSALFKADGAKEIENRRRANTREPHLWFFAAMQFALPMRQVLEIVNLDDSLAPMPGAPNHVAGMFDLRGRLVTVVDVRCLLRLEDDGTAGPQDRKILILEREGQLIGLLVDCICSILQVEPTQRMPVPQIMRNSVPSVVRPAVVDIIKADQPDGSTAHVLALDIDKIIAALAADENEVAHA